MHVDGMADWGCRVLTMEEKVAIGEYLQSKLDSSRLNQVSMEKLLAHRSVNRVFQNTPWKCSHVVRAWCAEQVLLGKCDGVVAEYIPNTHAAKPHWGLAAMLRSGWSEDCRKQFGFADAELLDLVDSAYAAVKSVTAVEHQAAALHEVDGECSHADLVAVNQNIEMATHQCVTLDVTSTRAAYQLVKNNRLNKGMGMVEFRKALSVLMLDGLVEGSVGPRPEGPEWEASANPNHNLNPNPKCDPNPRMPQQQPTNGRFRGACADCREEHYLH